MKTPSVAPIVNTSIGGRKGSSPRSTVDGNKIRSRLLRRLGIAPSMEGIAAHRPQALRKVEPFSEPLKYEDDDIEIRGEAQSEGSGTTQKRNKSSSVTFEERVSVIQIPKHQEYSQRIRSRLWSNKRELRIMAARNTVEYQAEGWDWRTVTEDDAFIITASGERIHPVHLRRLFSSSLMRQPLRLVQQQQQQQHQMPLFRQQQQEQHKSADLPKVDTKIPCRPESMSGTSCPEPIPGGALEDLARQ